MNKWILRFASFLVVMGLMVGCASNDQDVKPKDPQTEVETEEIVTITVSEDNGAEIIVKKEVPIEEGAILLDVMKENFEIVEDGGFITSVEGVEQDVDAGKYWLYTVDDEEILVGAAEYELKADEKIVFDLHALE